MKTWLFTWNRDRWAWDDKLSGFKELISNINQVGHAYTIWTCGMNKSIQPGDRIFLIKLGSKPKGIVASGTAMTNVFEGTHWDYEKQKMGIKARRVYIDFDKIKDCDKEIILDYDVLKSISSNFNWSTQASGIQIPENIAVQIEKRWKTI
ncbi:MAG: hypothetical protein ACI319_10405 [Holdemanella porci]